MQLKDKLKRIRKNRTYTQKELAKVSGVSLPVIQSYESGLRNPKDENLQKLAQTLDVDVWALRDLDIDMTNHNDRAAIYYFLFLLNEKGLFSVDDLAVAVNYNENHDPDFTVSFKTDRRLYNFFSKWICVASDDILTFEKLEDWQIDPYLPIDLDRSDYLSFLQGKTGRQIIPTKEILDAGLSDEIGLIDLLYQGAYTEEDFIRILRYLEDSPSFKTSELELDMLTAVFAEGNIPEEFIQRAFHETDKFGATIIQKGAVRHAYEKSLKLHPDELHRLTYDLRKNLKEYRELKKKGN